MNDKQRTNAHGQLTIDRRACWVFLLRTPLVSLTSLGQVWCLTGSNTTPPSSLGSQASTSLHAREATWPASYRECLWMWWVPPLDLAHETEQSTCPPGSHSLILWGRSKKDGPERSRKHVLKRSGHALSGFLDDHTEEVGEPEINVYCVWAVMRLLVYIRPLRLNETSRK